MMQPAAKLLNTSTVPGNLLISGLVLLGSALSGCTSLPPAPLILNLPDCPSPVRPDLPLVDGELPFDNLANINILLQRDDFMRAYIISLEATITCFQQQRGHYEPN